MQKALITGASSGIGKELALIMAAAGHDLVLVARNKDDLLRVQKEIIASHDVDVQVCAADLSLPGSAKKLYEQIRKQKIEILVNNAGAGLRGDFFHDNFDRTTRLAQLNMISLMELSQLFGRDFLEQNSGKILNIGSIVAFLPGPKQPAYYASKAFVRNLSRALAYNLRNTGVTVTTLHPGVTKTKFFESANVKNFTSGASARSVALLGYKAMMSGKIEVTHGFWNKLITNVVIRFIPYRLQAPVVDRSSDA